MRNKLFVGLLLLFGCIATVNLLHPGFPVTHDGDVHLMRLANFFQVLSEGILIPRWAANVNWGYGQPVFEFFYPLPSYLGSLLHFAGLSFADSLKLLLGLSLILSGITMYIWLSRITSREGAFLGAFLYMFAPYRFVDIYVRGDVGETFALIFVPLVLYFMQQTVKSTSKYPLLFGGISLSLLILGHNIVSLMMLPFILFYGGYLWWKEGKETKTGIKVIAIIIMGFLFSAFFWLPGLFEAKYTLRDIVTKGEYRQRFVDLGSLLYGGWSYGQTGSFTVQVGIAQWIMIVASLVLLVLKKIKQSLLVITLILYTCTAIFLMLPVSNFVWARIMLLQNFQFPWRFLLITIFSTACLGALVIDTLPKKMKNWSLIVVVCIVLLSQYTYWQAKAYVSRSDSTYTGIFKGPADTGESSPIWGIRFMESGYIHPLEILDGKATVQIGKRTSVEHDYIVHVEKAAQVMENTLYFPGWHVFVDGKEVRVEFQSELHRGLMIFSLPQGTHTVRVVFTNTKFRTMADYISYLSLFVLLLLLIPLPKRFNFGL